MTIIEITLLLGYLVCGYISIKALRKKSPSEGEQITTLVWMVASILGAGVLIVFLGVEGYLDFLTSPLW